MQKNLVIVESPAKAKTIEKYLGKDFKVLSSYGHIRDLKKKSFSIDVEHNFMPTYEISDDKKKVVNELKDEVAKVDTVWLASDEDREGEAISWHLQEVLKLNPATTKRIVFHEITKNALLKAIEEPRSIDVNLVNAQQARRVLDRIVGFELSPILWHKIKPSLSAGRVQSVAVRLIVEREREIQSFNSESNYRIVGVFTTTDAEGKKTEIKAELNEKFTNREDAVNFLELCKEAQFCIQDISTKPVKKSPAPPFTTSTLQQEAARKLGLTVAQTMMMAQRLYEGGKITYMRTDSVNLSSLAINTSKEEINKLFGANYSKPRQFATKSKGAQEAHEAIRPTYIADEEIEGTNQEQRLYNLIWKRTVASQMAEAELEKTTVTISLNNSTYTFVATGETIVFDGFLRLYRESSDDENTKENEEPILPQLSIGSVVERKEICANQRFTQSPFRYTEGSLVRKMEELGIGRPSTYAPTISTIQQRGYVEKKNCEGFKRDYEIIKLQKGNKISTAVKTETIGNEKNKLLPTDIGSVVNDFLMEFFPRVLDFNFTADVEKEFDEVAEGKAEWTKLIASFYQDFHPAVETSINTHTTHKVGERLLGDDPVSGKPVSVKIGKYGPIIQIGSTDDEAKPRFAQLPKGKSLETITLEDALECFKLPRSLGNFEEQEVTIGVGKFGPYIRHNGSYTSIPKELNPLQINLDEAIHLIEQKREAANKKVILALGDDNEIQILNGRYGPYIAFQGNNYRLPKDLVPNELTLQQCKEIIESQQHKETSKGRNTRKKK